jgi:hypothetical protein
VNNVQDSIIYGMSQHITIKEEEEDKVNTTSTQNSNNNVIVESENNDNYKNNSIDNVDKNNILDNVDKNNILDNSDNKTNIDYNDDRVLDSMIYGMSYQIPNEENVEKNQSKIENVNNENEKENKLELEKDQNNKNDNNDSSDNNNSQDKNIANLDEETLISSVNEEFYLENNNNKVDTEIDSDLDSKNHTKCEFCNTKIKVLAEYKFCPHCGKKPGNDLTLKKERKHENKPITLTIESALRCLNNF